MMTDQTVFVVEDEPEMRQSVCHVLASVSVPVETYADAEEFLEGEDGGRAGCLVTDVCLPGMSGFDLQRALARLQVQLPIIMITGYGDVRTAVRAMKAGAVDFIEKPFSGQLLLDSVAQAFKRAGCGVGGGGERAARGAPRERGPNARSSVFALRVRGTGMAEDGLYDGDRLIVERGAPADGRTAVVEVDGRLAVKRVFRDRDGVVRLHPASPTLL